MAKVIAITNQKGGVGKTTSAVNLAAALGALGKRILLVDIDPQGNATSGVGLSKREIQLSSYQLLLGLAPLENVVKATKFQNLHILPAGMSLAGAEIELVGMENREYQLKNAILRSRDQYDFILIDCPPSLGLLTLNALAAADTLLVPIQCEYFALEGLSQLMATVRQVKKLYNPYIDMEGVLLTMYDGRLNLTIQVADEVKKYFPGKVFKTVIPRSVRLSEAPSFGLPVTYYEKNSKGAKAYEDLAKELVKKQRKEV